MFNRNQPISLLCGGAPCGDHCRHAVGHTTTQRAYLLHCDLVESSFQGIITGHVQKNMHDLRVSGSPLARYVLWGSDQGSSEARVPSASILTPFLLYQIRVLVDVWTLAPSCMKRASIFSALLERNVHSLTMTMQ